MKWIWTSVLQWKAVDICAALYIPTAWSLQELVWPRSMIWLGQSKISSLDKYLSCFNMWTAFLTMRHLQMHQDRPEFISCIPPFFLNQEALNNAPEWRTFCKEACQHAKSICVPLISHGPSRRYAVLVRNIAQVIFCVHCLIQNIIELLELGVSEAYRMDWRLGFGSLLIRRVRILDSAALWRVTGRLR